jgi:large subunit ribosomal protein L10
LAATFCPEDVAPVAKVIDDFGREVADDREFGIVGGILEGEVLDAARAQSLASLPSKEILFAQILAGIHAPGSQLVGTIANSVRQILNVLQARIDQFEEAEAAA